MRQVMRLFRIAFWCGVVVLGVYSGHAWWQDHVRPDESADNAYVRTHMAQLSARVTGHVKAVYFDDNQVVAAGSLLIEIDDAPLLAQRDQAAAEVAIEIDAYPHLKFASQIDSTAPASGAEFSILPPENATGNFTKIVRRVPVKIRFDAASPHALLKPGWSGVVKVRVR